MGISKEYRDIVKKILDKEATNFSKISEMVGIRDTVRYRALLMSFCDLGIIKNLFTKEVLEKDCTYELTEEEVLEITSLFNREVEVERNLYSIVCYLLSKLSFENSYIESECFRAWRNFCVNDKTSGLRKRVSDISNMDEIALKSLFNYGDIESLIIYTYMALAINSAFIEKREPIDEKKLYIEEKRRAIEVKYGLQILSLMSKSIKLENNLKFKDKQIKGLTKEKDTLSNKNETLNLRVNNLELKVNELSKDSSDKIKETIQSGNKYLSDLTALRGKYTKERKKNEELQSQIKYLKTYKEYFDVVNNIPEVVQPEEKVEIDLSILQKERILVFGGGDNWQKNIARKLDENRLQFKVVRECESNVMPAIRDLDVVVMNTKHLGHSSYFAYMKEIKAKNVLLYQTSTANVNLILNEVCRMYGKKVGI